MIRNFNRTKIIATTGPASNTYDTLLELVKTGVDIFRLNFSHGSHADHKKIFDHVEKINRAYRLNIGILADLQGPKIRIGDIEGGSMNIEVDQVLKFVTKECIGNAKQICITYDRLPMDVTIGEKILIDDGKLELEVTDTNKLDFVTAKVLHGGELSSKKGVNLPNTKISTPSMTQKDLDDLEFALNMGVNWVALSFVRSPHDIVELRRIIDAKDSVKIIAKIEKPEAVAVIDDIIEVADAIMIARGDLGVEVALEQMPIIQKDIIKKCIYAAKPVIVATQILDSMITSARPTRAEINDVANDMIDGADALMLSGETSVGEHPVKVIQTIRKIMDYVEKHGEIYNKNLVPQPGSKTFLSDAICYNSAKLAEEVGAKVIVGMTRSGYTAFMVSSYRPHAKIIIFTDNEDLLNILSLSWGVQAYYYDKMVSTDDTISDVIEIMKVENLVEAGDVVINTGSMPIHQRQRTNMLKITMVS